MTDEGDVTDEGVATSPRVTADMKPATGGQKTATMTREAMRTCLVCNRGMTKPWPEVPSLFPSRDGDVTGT